MYSPLPFKHDSKSDVTPRENNVSPPRLFTPPPAPISTVQHWRSMRNHGARVSPLGSRVEVHRPSLSFRFCFFGDTCTVYVSFSREPNEKENGVRFLFRKTFSRGRTQKCKIRPTAWRPVLSVSVHATFMHVRWCWYSVKHATESTRSRNTVEHRRGARVR